MNLLYTYVPGSDLNETKHQVESWRNEHQIVAELPFERLTSYLRFDPGASLALIDAIVCSATLPPLGWGAHGPFMRWPVTRAVKLAQDVRSLPSSSAMSDGRKWRAYLFTLPKGAALNWQRIALVLNTLVVFGFLVSWFRDALRSLSFWATLSMLLLGHMAAYLLLLDHTEGWPLAYYLVLNPMELAIFTPILKKIVKNGDDDR